MRTSTEEIVTTYGKVPPQNIEAEKAVLGAILIEKNAILIASSILKGEMFYMERHRIVYESCSSLFSKGEPTDLLTVKTQLEKRGHLTTVGGIPALMDLAECIGSAANIEFHSRMIVEAHVKRSLINICSEITREAFEHSSDPFELLDNLQTKLVNASRDVFGSSVKSLKDLIVPTLKEIQATMESKGKMSGVPSGFDSIDALVGGFQKGELIILAARPSMGKTTLAVNFAQNAFKANESKTLIFSLEMSSPQLVKKMISTESGVRSSAMTKGNINEYEMQNIADSAMEIYTDNISIDDTPNQSVMQMRSKAMNVKLKNGLDMVIVDYLQLAKGDYKGNREQEISSISRGLKIMAKELDVPVIALSQLSRSVETRGGDKRPMLSDLRESGAIEQDADIVAFVYRPEYYGITENEDGTPTSNMAEVIFSKNRNGALATVNLGVRFDINKFTNY